MRLESESSYLKNDLELEPKTVSRPGPKRHAVTYAYLHTYLELFKDMLID